MRHLRFIAAGLLTISLGTTHADTAGTTHPFPKQNIEFIYNASVAMSDGLELMINVYRPEKPGKYPVIITHGIYGKDISWKNAKPYKDAWRKMTAALPNLCDDSTCEFLRWEMPDPERWVPEGYVVIQADSRGSGKTGGYMGPLGPPRETQDYKELIEWAARQPWSNGKVGLLGISYYAMNQWRVASLRPEGLAAIIPWEGAADFYRDVAYHGGVPSTSFLKSWLDRQVIPNQHGNPNSPFVDAVTGQSAVGPAMDETYVQGNRVDLVRRIQQRPLNSTFYQDFSQDLSRIEVPTFSVGNWGGVGLHLRGNVEGYLGAGTDKKWLRIHTGDHYTPFYSSEAFVLQKSFFDHFLKGDKKAFTDQPPVQVLVRHPSKGDFWRDEESWPLSGTRFTKFHLNADNQSLSRRPAKDGTRISYDPLTSDATFRLAPSARDREFTGPLKARLWVKANASDQDFFLTIRLFDPQGKDVTFPGANAPAVPVTSGWLRLSHRAVNEHLSKPYRPVRDHDHAEPAKEGSLYPLDIEIWPTSIVVPAGYTLALTVQGRDFEFPHITKGPFTGSFPFLHERPSAPEFAAKHTLLTGAQHDSYLLMPLIPTER